MSRAADRAYAAIKAQILSGALAPGVQIREEELAVTCGVSRTPVRDAMHRLEAEMFIRRSDSQRSFVSDWSGDDIEEVFTLRTMLEGHAAAQAAARVTPDVLAALRCNLAAIHATVDRSQPDIEALLANNAEFHALIAQAAASERLALMLNRLILQPIVHRTALRYDEHQWRRSLSEHVEIVAALEARDRDWARAVMTSHIRRAFHVYREKRS